MHAKNRLLGRAVGTGGRGTPLYFWDQLTLSQPWVQIMSTTLIQVTPPRIFRPLGSPVFVLSICGWSNCSSILAMSWFPYGHLLNESF